MKTPHIQLSPSEKDSLQALLSKGSLRAQQYKRATALQLLDAGKSLAETSRLLHVSYTSLWHWRKHYLAQGLTFLQDRPRPGRPVIIDGLQRAKITALATSQAPQGRARWTLRLLADKVVELGYCAQISHNAVGDILKKTISNPTSNANGASAR